jgi:CheY-like chemotaxis protein
LAGAFNEIDTSSKEMMKLVEDVLAVSDMEYDVIKLDNITFDFSAMLKEVFRNLDYYMTRKKHSFSYDIDYAIPMTLIGDEKRLKRVISNFLSNAIKFTPERGSISLVAKMLNDKSGVVTLQIEIADNGIGISKENQGKLFDFFEQGDGSQTREYGGSGLGLAISKRIIEMMDGSISLESELGKGAKFTVTCKLKKESGISEIGKSKNSIWKDRIDSEEADFRGKFILVADDMASNRMVVKHVLESTGAQIIEAETGKQAIDRYFAEPETVDVILMDIRMPEMDGLKATKAIRSSGLPGAEKLPILALMAHSSEEDVKAAKEAGMNLHFGRPVELQMLIEALKIYLV